MEDKQVSKTEETQPGDKIMIIDDDKFLLDIYNIKFKEQGFDVSTMESASAALEELKSEEKYAVVLLDLVMPGMDGLSFLEEVRKQKVAPETSFIVLSNQGNPADIEKAKSFNIDGYIVKASTIPSEVVDQVKEVIQGKK